MPCFHIGLLCGKRLDTIYIIGFEDIWIHRLHAIGYIADLVFSTVDGSHMATCRSHVDGSRIQKEKIFRYQYMWTRPGNLVAN